jgi:hypothetical protein
MYFWLITRCLAVVLLAAAGLKVYGFGVDPVAPTGTFSAPAFQFLVIAFEIILAVWLLSGKYAVGSWLVALITFFGFTVISFFQGWIGQASCGCLGSKVTVNPWLMFVIDLAVVAALLVSRPDLRPLWEHRTGIVRTGGIVFVWYVLVLGTIAGFAHYRYGSIDAALASLRHERLSVNPRLIDMGQGAPGEIREATVEFANRTDQPIRLIGGTLDCSCTVLGDLPFTIPPGTAHSITITVRLPNSTGSFNRKAELKIDDQGFNTVGFRLTGRLNKAPENVEK